MAKHRASVYTVVREELNEVLQTQGFELGQNFSAYEFSALIGTYATLQRAEEVMGASAQAFRDAGTPDGSYKFSVKVTTYYDE